MLSVTLSAPTENTDRNRCIIMAEITKRGTRFLSILFVFPNAYYNVILHFIFRFPCDFLIENPSSISMCSLGVSIYLRVADIVIGVIRVATAGSDMIFI